MGKFNCQVRRGLWLYTQNDVGIWYSWYGARGQEVSVGWGDNDLFRLICEREGYEYC